VAARTCVDAALHIPRAAVGTSPVQHSQVARPSCLLTSELIPRAAIRAQPLEHGQVATRSRRSACAPIPRAPVCAQPLQHREVAAESCGRTGGAAIVEPFCAPIAALLAEGPELLKVAAARWEKHHITSETKATGDGPLQEEPELLERHIDAPAGASASTIAVSSGR
jgi:hypothetical protein